MMCANAGKFDRQGPRYYPSTWTYLNSQRCDLFNRAYHHISETIDQVYKDLTKGKSAPMGGVAYLSLEDTEVHFD